MQKRGMSEQTSNSIETPPAFELRNAGIGPDPLSRQRTEVERCSANLTSVFVLPPVLLASFETTTPAANK